MTQYTYESLETGEEFIIEHRMTEPAMTHHPETGEAIQRLITGAPAVHVKGLKSHVRVNYRSPAATACGCASNAALAKQMFHNSRQTPRYGSTDSKKTVPGGVNKSSGCGHSHSHSHGKGKCGHKH